jgi:hypothetical protein
MALLALRDNPGLLQFRLSRGLKGIQAKSRVRPWPIPPPPEDSDPARSWLCGGTASAAIAGTGNILNLHIAEVYNNHVEKFIPRDDADKSRLIGEKFIFEGGLN